jgi:ribulose-5-phosphate 4-epimerase/fuculose-1-phosphate aldolase
MDFMLMPAPMDSIDSAEATLRSDLAACYRLVAHFGWDDLVATHISVRLPGGDAFLINPYGMLFDEIRPGDLIKVNLEGKVLSATEWPVNEAGFVIHSAIHSARHDAVCVMHLHTRDGVAVSMLVEGLLPLNQTAMAVVRDIASHDYEGIAVNLEERARLAKDLGDKHLMILRNHGTLAIGPSVADAFTSMYLLEWACSAQVRALSMGRALNEVSPKVVDGVASYRSGGRVPIAQNLIWPAMLRKLDRLDPGWRS